MLFVTERALGLKIHFGAPSMTGCGCRTMNDRNKKLKVVVALAAAAAQTLIGNI